MPIKKSKPNNKSVKVSKLPTESKNKAKVVVNYPLLFLALLTIMAVLVSLVYFYHQQYKYMNKYSNNMETRYERSNGTIGSEKRMNNSK